MYKHDNEKLKVNRFKSLNDFPDMKLSKSSGGYIMNQVNCILSLDRNRQSDFQNVSELFSTYNKILENETSKDFKTSLDKSKSCFVSQCYGNDNIHKEEMQSLEKNNPNSFLIVPMVSHNHLFCSVVRKNDLGYSATLVNASKGGRRGDDRGNHVGYEEYVFSEDNLQKLSDCCKATKHGMGFSSKLSNSQIYEMFEKLADKRFNLSIISRDQKDGNCYVKEPEKAIKFALATSFFSPEKFELLREPNGPVFTAKWPVLSEEIHKRYIEKLKNENPGLSNLLDDKFNKYLDYKNFVKSQTAHKFLVSGRSLHKKNEITFQNNLAEVKAVGKKTNNDSWSYVDSSNNLIGYSRNKDDKSVFYDTKDQMIGYSKKERIGERFYDNEDRLIGYARFFYGMNDYNGEVCGEQKGKNPVDIMISLSKENQMEKPLSMHMAKDFIKLMDPNRRLMARYMDQKISPRHKGPSRELTL